MSLLRACLVLAFLILAASAACSSSSNASDCTSNPFQCGTGTTCSLSSCNCTTKPCTDSNCTPVFACLPSQNGAMGEDCTASPGNPACSDLLVCVATSGQGECLPYCNSANPCPQGSVCQPKTVELGPSPPIIYVCEPESDSAFPFNEGGCGPPPPTDDSGPKPDTGSPDSSGPIIPDGGLPR
jgi:hypothetical protein